MSTNARPPSTAPNSPIIPYSKNCHRPDNCRPDANLPKSPNLLSMNEISFVDTTLRDGQQSLWALNMKTDAMLGAAEQMDQAGFESLEFFSSNMIKKYVREHKENPWEWIRQGTKKFRHTKLRLHGGIHGSGAFEKLPSAIMTVSYTHLRA